MSEIELYQPGQLSLFELAETANREHALVGADLLSAAQHAWLAGQALLEAKSQVQHGEWLPWLTANFNATDRTAQNYMRVASNTKHVSDLQESTQGKALKAITDGNRSVTYKNQPAIDASNGSVPLEGTSHLYRVHKLLWPEQVEEVLASLLIPTSLHACCGQSQLGDFRVDTDAAQAPDLVADAAALPLEDDSYDSVLCDPPYNGEMQWNHDMLSELARVASRRIVFQHWFIPANPDGRYKKAQDKFSLSQIMVWQPKTYFGRAQLISVFDAQ